MECLVANVENIKFDIEIALENQHDILPSPFPGMDKSMTAVCEFYVRGECNKDTMCPLRPGLLQQPHHQQHSYPHGVPQSMYHTNLYQQQQQQEMKHNPPPPSDQNQS
ncbi:cleavage and polyadenylation specificity factor subunit 4-like [Diaphorina citri]|uniref:Cleavage and polyadenylation specificity factor subunit 4-like n=1 Tax=Diaphorina citri TaxID=121845 RepID=A0A1S3DF73_DIACI|nr:cleavage and polyadenylation specificity factor subunit 4-like [Diaphorina citri]